MDATPTIVGHRGIRTLIHCPRPECRRAVAILAVPVRGEDGEVWTSYRARGQAGTVQAGEPLTHCPFCGAEYARLTWGDCKDELGRSS